MKIYTRKGDDGTTGLLGPTRILKCEHRLDCTGALDELNASLGLACAAISPSVGPGLKRGETPPLQIQLRQIQNELFVLGSRLAAPDPAAATNLPVLDSNSISRLEHEIDAADAALAPLKNFILPGGTELAARLHVARTICRRAERTIVAFSKDNIVDQSTLAYANRLSDWLFTMARLANRNAGVADIPWQK